MLRHANHYTTFLILVLLVTQVFGLSIEGGPIYFETRSESVSELSNNPLGASFHHHAEHSHEDESSTQHDASNHVHEKADTLIKQGNIVRRHTIATLAFRPGEGLPIRRTFRFERPPKA